MHKQSRTDGPVPALAGRTGLSALPGYRVSASAKAEEVNFIIRHVIEAKKFVRELDMSIQVVTESSTQVPIFRVVTSSNAPVIVDQRRGLTFIRANALRYLGNVCGVRRSQ
jgi:hypothetical protein